MNALPYTRAAALPQLLRDRIVVLDGAMGTMIQRYKLGEGDYRGDRFRDHPKSLKGNGDILQLTRPDVVEAIHEAYLRAGADIVETNTFSGTAIAQADYGMQGLAHELNREAALIAREAAALAEAKDGRRRFVAGAMGPTNRTASISPDVNNPGYRAVSFDDLRLAYGEQARGLVEGGAHLLRAERAVEPDGEGLRMGERMPEGGRRLA